MKPNMNIADSVIHYAILMIIVIAGGLMHSPAFMLLGMPFFFCAILGYNPVYSMLGIDHNNEKMS